jgi:hypothetical protein
VKVKEGGETKRWKDGHRDESERTRQGNSAESRSRKKWRVAGKSGEGAGVNRVRTAIHSCNPPTNLPTNQGEE